jgi:hypothetical protein
MDDRHGLKRREFLRKAFASFSSLPLVTGWRSGAAAAAERERAASKSVISLGPGPHLFVDDHLIARSSGLTRTTHQPERLPAPVIAKAEPWHEMPLFFHKVIRDQATGRFRMWYNIRNNGPDVPSTCYAYAESEDGIHWRRAPLHLVEVGGSSENNLFKVVSAFGLGLIDDGPNAKDPERRHKMAYYRLSAPAGLCVAFSADGIHFSDDDHNPVLTDLGDIVDACYDPLRARYVACFKSHSTAADGYRGSTPNAPEGYRRLVGESTSEDWVHWRPPWRIVVADPNEPGMWEFYGVAPQVRGNLSLGFLRVLRDDLPATEGGPVQGIGWTELVTSRDGESWTRYREPFLDRNPGAATWDHAMAWVGDCVTVGDREYVYYGGYSAGHKVGNRQIGVAMLRRNGFVSRDAGAQPGRLRTPLVKLSGSRMTVNATVKDELRVRVLDEEGRALSGFGFPDCQPVRGDACSHPVRWKQSLAALHDKAVRLDFEFREGQLYGFELAA